MSFFRSRQMKHYSLVVPRESVWAVMDQLGSLGQLHFVDYDPTFPMLNRPFANYVKRCDESLFKLAQIESQLKEFKREIIPCKNVDNLMLFYKEMLKNRQKPGHTYFEELEQEIEKKRAQITEQAQNWQNLQDRANNINEQQQVLLKCKQLMGPGLMHSNQENQQQPGTGFFDEMKDLRVKFSQIIGVLDKEDEIRFKRMIFRITKGNAWVQLIDIQQAEQLEKFIDSTSKIRCLFVVVFPAMDDSSLLKTKLSKVCESFSKSRYEFPNSMESYQKRLNDLNSQLIDTQHLIQMSKQQILQSLEEFIRTKQGCNCSYFEQIRLYVIKEKYLYMNLNYLVMQGSVFTGAFWLPAKEDQNVENALREISKSNLDRIPTGQIQETQPINNATPPTFFKLNEVTGPFQEIVNTYGIPRYQEINPGLFTVVTFPFIFAVMFADIGHGFMLLLAGLYVTFFKKSLEQSDSVFKLMIPVRYMILLMGFYATYNGLIYNDYLSIPLNLFGSCYTLSEHKDGKEMVGEWSRKADCVYPFGIDPVWLASNSALVFINSYKMKLAVIIGVVHMIFGIIMKGWNSIYFGNKIDFFCEFIPQLLFMLCAFGWMDFLIIIKWFSIYPDQMDPSIIDTMINQILAPFDIPLKPVFDGNLQLQLGQLFTVIALICVPWMLIPKPCLLVNQQNKHHHQPYTKIRDQEQYPPLIPQDRSESEVDLDPKQFEQALQRAASKSSLQGKNHQVEEHDSSDIVVHQLIETIEFVLGGISNTASYLRLWALSLAHGQLAEVFFDQCIATRITIGGGVIGGMIGAYAYLVFALLTFGVLMMMDVMECFLHALRLHWVEFQSKFYKADGYIFVSYSYQNILKTNASHPED